MGKIDRGSQRVQKRSKLSSLFLAVLHNESDIWNPTPLGELCGIRCPGASEHYSNLITNLNVLRLGSLELEELESFSPKDFIPSGGQPG